MAKATIQYTAEIRDLRKQLASLPDITRAEARKMVAEMNKGIKGMERAQKRAQKSAFNTAKAFRGITLAITPADFIRMGSAITGFGQDVADLRNELVDTSTKTGIAAETLQGLRLAAEGSGQSFESLISPLSQFPKRLADFERGIGEAKEGLNALGFSSEDATGLLDDTDGALIEITKRLQGVENPGRRAAIATQVFGKAGGKLLQSLSGTELEEFVSLARDFGVDVGPDAASAAADWQRAMAEFSTVLQGVQGDLVDLFGGADFLEDFTLSLVFVSKFVEESVKGWIREFETFARATEALMALDFKGFAKITTELEGWGKPLEDAAAAAGQYAFQFWESRKAIRDANKGVRSLGTDTGKAADNAERFAEAMGEDFADDMAKHDDAMASLAEVTESAQRAAMTDAERLTAEYGDQLEAIKLLSEETGASAEAREAEAAVTKAYTEDLHTIQMAQIAAERDARMDSLSTVASATVSVESALAVMRSQNLENQSRSEKETAQAVFKLRKTLAVGAVGLNAYIAISEAIASAPFPWNIPSVLGATAQVVPQVAGVQAMTATFSDTPGPVQAPASGLVRLDPEDKMIAARDMDSLQAQASAAFGSPFSSGPKPVVVMESHRNWDRFGRDALRSEGAWSEVRRQSRRTTGRRS